MTNEEKRKILLLGGTSDALRLRELIKSEFDFSVTYSLAGATKFPKLPDDEVHLGGFGGTSGLVNYLHKYQIDLIVDATHPYARQMSQQARAASFQTGIPSLRFERPAWTAGVGDHWHVVHDLAAAVMLAPKIGTRVLLTTGRKNLTPIVGNIACWWLVRVVEPRNDLPTIVNGEYLFARGPFDAAAERATMIEHEIELVISKNSGGSETYGKIAAAKELALPVIMIDRPMPESSNPTSVDNIAAVRKWLLTYT